MISPRSHTSAQITWIAVMDVACLVVGCMLGVMLRFGHDDMKTYVFDHLEGWLLLFGGVILANYLAGSYRVQYTFSRFNLVVTWAFSLLFALLILSMTSLAWFRIVLGRGVLFLSLASYSALALFFKLVVYPRLFRSEFFMCRTAILGVGDQARKVRRIIENRLVLPAHKVVTCIRVVPEDARDDGSTRFMDGVTIIDGTAGFLEEIIRSLDVSLLVVAPDDTREITQLYPLLRRLRFLGTEVLTPLNVAEIYAGLTPLDQMDQQAMMQIGMASNLPVMRRVKRLFDLLFSLLLAPLLIPLCAAVALLVKLTDFRSPVIYSQMRVGQFGRLFRIFKFRTMRADAEAESGAVWAAPDDARITRIGRILRRFRLDEMPQFWNVLQGDMSMVGPRPERPEFVADLADRIPYFSERENALPGVTGWAQVRYPYGWTVEDSARKLEYDLYYIKHLSLSLDLQIILSTLRIVLFGKERSQDR